MKKFMMVFIIMFAITQNVYATEVETNNTNDTENTENVENTENNTSTENTESNENTESTTSTENTETNTDKKESNQLGQIVKPSITESINTNSDIDLKTGDTTTSINTNDNTNNNNNTNNNKNNNTNTNNTNNTNNINSINSSTNDNNTNTTTNETNSQNTSVSDNENTDETDSINSENNSEIETTQESPATSAIITEENVIEAKKNNNKSMISLVIVLVILGIGVGVASFYLNKRKEKTDKELDEKLSMQRELLLKSIPDSKITNNKIDESKITNEKIDMLYIAKNNIGEVGDIDEYINQLESSEHNTKKLSYYHKGIQAFDNGNYDEAKKLFLLQIEYEYYVEESSMYLTEICIANSDYDGALEVLKQILMKDPNNEQAITIKMEILTNLGRYNECVLEYTELISKDDNRKYEFILARAMCKMAIGKYSSAVHDYDMVIADNSANAEAYFNRGLANMVLKNNDSALRDIKLAVSIDEDKYGEKGNKLIVKLEGQLEQV